MKRKRIILYTLWVLSFLVVPITAFTNTPWDLISGDRNLTINLFQRLFGMFSVILLFTLIILGAFMEEISQIIGGVAYRLHTFLGIFTYFVIFLHPLMQYILHAPVYAGFLDRLNPQRDIFVAIGTLSFVLITLTVIAGRFRVWPSLRRNWKKVHIVNYFVFFLIHIHADRLGTDMDFGLYSIVEHGMLLVVGFIVFYKFYNKFFSQK